MQNLEQFKMIEACKDLIETINQQQSPAPRKARAWRHILAQQLLGIAQWLEPKPLPNTQASG